jgi:hypothetical protein
VNNLINMSTEQFPLNWDRYNRLMNEIQTAAYGFVDLDDLGWPRGREIDAQLMRAHHALWEAWNLIQETECELRAREAAKPNA